MHVRFKAIMMMQVCVEGMEKILECHSLMHFHTLFEQNLYFQHNIQA